MRKIYKVKVNNKVYEVELEKVSEAPGSIQNTAPVAQAAAPAATSGAGTVVSAPMPGSIFDIKVKAGDSVAAGQVLMILEAMKMENEIVAPQAGVVQSISVAKGQQVTQGDSLVTLG